MTGGLAGSTSVTDRDRIAEILSGLGSDGGSGPGGGGRSSPDKIQSHPTDTDDHAASSCTVTWNFDFNQFADQIEENRLDLGATLVTLIAAEAIGTMPKTPNELRGLGVPKSDLNPYTSQLSRWSERLGARWMRDFGRTKLGVFASGVAILAVVFEGFYDVGVIGNAAWDATSRQGCSQ